MSMSWKTVGWCVVWSCLLGIESLGGPGRERIVIGESPEGRAIVVEALGDVGLDARGLGRDDRPAIAIIAGVSGMHVVGMETASNVAARLLAEHGELLSERTVYVVSVVNPDGAAKYRNGTPRVEFGRAPDLIDADRDGRVGEDPGLDLDGDGMVLMMRVPAPNHRYGLEATHMIDPDDGRLMRRAQPEKGERATHAILIEGRDSDGDGAFSEDGWGGRSGGGIDLDRHFPTHWPDLAEGAGLYPLQRSEARVLVQWLQGRPNIGAVVVYGEHDTIASIPGAGEYGPEGRVPKGIEKGDQAYYNVASEKFREITGISKGTDSDRSGSFVQWAYADLGVYAFSTPVWVRPDLVKRTEDGEKGDVEKKSEQADPERDPAAEEAAQRRALAERGVPSRYIEFLFMSEEARKAELASFESATIETQSAMMEELQALPDDVRARVMALAQGMPDPERAAGGAEPPAEASRRGSRGDSDEAKWLAWIDEERGGDGFVEWRAFEHPDLGPVEIGGFVPGIRVTPPASELDRLAAEQTAFAVWLVESLPNLTVEEVSVERVGGRLWRIGVLVGNDGLLPTVSAIGEKARRLSDDVVVLDPEGRLDREAIVSGRRVERLGVIAGSGQVARVEWLVRAEDGSRVGLEIRSARFGNRSMAVNLEESR